MKKILYLYIFIVFAVLIGLYTKPYGLFDLSMSTTHADHNVDMVFQMKKIDLQMNKKELKFSIVDHPREVNGAWFSQDYKRYWESKPSAWLERHGNNSSQFYDELVRDLSRNADVENFKRCVLDIQDYDNVSYICYMKGNQRYQGFLKNLSANGRKFINRLEKYDSKIQKMGPRNVCKENVGYCNQ